MFCAGRIKESVPQPVDRTLVPKVHSRSIFSSIMVVKLALVLHTDIMAEKASHRKCNGREEDHGCRVRKGSKTEAAAGSH